MFEYNHKDVILYNIGLGATSKELKYTYENDSNFQVLPTFAVMPVFNSPPLAMDTLVDNFNYAMLLHGEQYFKIGQNPIPVKGALKTEVKPLQVIDKGGKAAVIVAGYKSVDAKTNKLVSYNESTFFVRGAHVPPNKRSTTNLVLHLPSKVSRHLLTEPPTTKWKSKLIKTKLQFTDFLAISIRYILTQHWLSKLVFHLQSSMACVHWVFLQRLFWKSSVHMKN